MNIVNKETQNRFRKLAADLSLEPPRFRCWSHYGKGLSDAHFLAVFLAFFFAFPLAFFFAFPLAFFFAFPLAFFFAFPLAFFFAFPLAFFFTFPFAFLTGDVAEDLTDELFALFC